MVRRTDIRIDGHSYLQRPLRDLKTLNITMKIGMKYTGCHIFLARRFPIKILEAARARIFGHPVYNDLICNMNICILREIIYYTWYLIYS